MRFSGLMVVLLALGLVVLVSASAEAQQDSTSLPQSQQSYVPVTPVDPVLRQNVTIACRRGAYGQAVSPDLCNCFVRGVERNLGPQAGFGLRQMYLTTIYRNDPARVAQALGTSEAVVASFNREKLMQAALDSLVLCVQQLKDVSGLKP